MTTEFEAHLCVLAAGIRPGFEKFVSLLECRGRRESRAPGAPVDPARRSTRASHAPKHMGKGYRYNRDIPASPAQWFYGCSVLSSGYRLVSPRRLAIACET